MATTPTTTRPGTPRQVPAGPPRRATPRLLRDLVTDRLAMMSQAAATYGDAVRIRVGPKTLYLFNHPEHAKHILADNAGNYRKGIGLVQAKRALGDGLLTSEGELWREQRRTIQPVFQHRRIAARAGIVAGEARALVERLRARAGGPPVDVMEEFTGLTLGVLGRTLLDSDLDEFDSIGHSFEAVQDQAMFEMVTMGAVPQWVPLPAQLRFQRARADLQHVVDILVERRRANLRGDGDDVLTRLILSSDREPDPEVGRARLRDEMITLLLAGHETTASTLGWSLHLLDSAPEVWQRMHEEAVAVLGDRDPTDEDLRQFVYIGQVIQEVIRLYPPVWILTRQAVGDDVVNGYTVPAGADVVVCPYTLHRHPDLWPEPERFDPDRFAADRAGERPRYAHIPFGAGPRFCVGSHLGLMEATFVLALLARDLRLRVAPGHTVTPQPMLSLRLGGGLPMLVTPR